MEALLVAHHLDCDVVVLLVVVGLDHLPEAPLPDHLQHLVPVRQVVVRDVGVRTLELSHDVMGHIWFSHLKYPTLTQIIVTRQVWLTF